MASQTSILLLVKEFLGIGLNSQERTTIEVEDGVRGTESPQNIASVSSPPDGGKRAWFIVVACAVIRFCSTIVLSLLNQSKVVCADFDEELFSYPGYDNNENLYYTWKSLSEQTKTTAIFEAFSDMSKIGIPLAAVLMTKFGYRIVGLVGCGMVAFGLLVSSWINCKISGLIGFFTGGVAGIGMSFIQLTSIVPLLEYFDEKRMRAIICVRLGEILGGLIIQGVAVEKNPDVYWRHIYRYQLVLMILASLACVTLIPLKRKPQEYPQLVGRILGISDWNFFKNPMLYLFMLIFFFDQFGRPLPIERLNVGTVGMYLGGARAFGFMPYVGDLIAVVGLFFWKKQTLIFVLFIMGCLDITVGLWTVQVPYLISQGWIIVYLIIFGIETGVFESVVHDIIPKLFGTENIRITVGLLHLAGGIGEIISAASNGATYKTDSTTSFKTALKLAGAMLILAGLASFASRQFLIRRKASNTAKTVSTNNEGNNSITNVNITHDNGRGESNRVYINTIAFNSTPQDGQNWQLHQADTRRQSLTGTSPHQSTHTTLTDDSQRIPRPTVFNNLGRQFHPRQGDNRSDYYEIVGDLEARFNRETTSSNYGFTYDNSNRLQVNQTSNNEDNTERQTYRYSGRMDSQHNQHEDRQPYDLDRVEMEPQRRQDEERQHYQHEGRQPYDLDRVEMEPQRRQDEERQHYQHEGRQPYDLDRVEMEPQRRQDEERQHYQHEGRQPYDLDRVEMEPQRRQDEERQQSYPNRGRLEHHHYQHEGRQQTDPDRVGLGHQRHQGEDRQSPIPSRVRMDHQRYQDGYRQPPDPDRDRMDPQRYQDGYRQPLDPDRDRMDHQRYQDGYRQPPDPDRDRMDPQRYQNKDQQPHYPNSARMEHRHF